MSTPEKLPEKKQDETNTAIAVYMKAGDISKLSHAQQNQLLVNMCESLGLNPLTRPFDVVRLNGQDKIYASRVCTDQLAAIYRINRTLTVKPEIRTIGKVEVLFCECTATHPNGRIETSTATIPLKDPFNDLMKVETKAKRRATLSILGLGLLDETEIADMRAQGILKQEKTVQTWDSWGKSKQIDTPNPDKSEDSEESEETLEKITVSEENEALHCEALKNCQGLAMLVDSAECLKHTTNTLKTLSKRFCELTREFDNDRFLRAIDRLLRIVPENREELSEFLSNDRRNFMEELGK